MSNEPPPIPAPRNDNPPNATCSFRGKLRRDAGPMVEGPNDVYICVSCVRIASKIADDIEKGAISSPTGT